MSCRRHGRAKRESEELARAKGRNWETSTESTERVGLSAERADGGNENENNKKIVDGVGKKKT